MTIWEIFLISVGLAMDAFAVAVCKGLKMPKINKKQTVLIALFFGGFQGLMPLIGYFLGKQFEEYIVSVDHWITFVLLGFIGGKMIYESFKKDEDEEDKPFSIKVSVPIGVVAIIYESRPNVTSDAAALCLKSGNVCVLRGGKEAYNTSSAIVRAMRAGLENAGFDPDFVNILEDVSRAGANELMTANGYVDLLIPRGGKGLIKTCVEESKVPCIETGTGLCHVYVDCEADVEMARDIIVNAKTSRPSVCNAAEVCLVHADIAEKFLPILKKALVDDRIENGAHPVELRLDERAAQIIEGCAAGEEDFDTEFLDYKLAVAVVDSADSAISHISAHSTHHSESIITRNSETAEKFLRLIDSAAVYHNASTRFTDGGEFGLGCEMGISTQKLHARGPMGLCELCTYKYVVRGNGNVR